MPCAVITGFHYQVPTSKLRPRSRASPEDTHLPPAGSPDLPHLGVQQMSGQFTSQTQGIYYQSPDLPLHCFDLASWSLLWNTREQAWPHWHPTGGFPPRRFLFWKDYMCRNVREAAPHESVSGSSVAVRSCWSCLNVRRRVGPAEGRGGLSALKDALLLMLSITFRKQQTIFPIFIHFMVAYLSPHFSLFLVLFYFICQPTSCFSLPCRLSFLFPLSTSLWVIFWYFSLPFTALHAPFILLSLHLMCWLECICPLNTEHAGAAAAEVGFHEHLNPECVTNADGGRAYSDKDRRSSCVKT